MDTPTKCPACGTDWSGGQTCEDDFHQFGYWELEYLLYDVHHLMVPCYYLQHPHLMSPEWLNGAQGMVAAFLEEGVTPQEMRQRMKNNVAGGNREYNMTARPGQEGSYSRPVVWTMTARDVVDAGMDRYYESVRVWAASILASLRAAGQMGSDVFYKP